jgi:hypothetical protein
MSAYRDDSRELADRLADDIESVLSKYWPGWIRTRQKGKDVAFATPRIKEKGKKPTSSFVVHLQGDDRGKWYRFSADLGGHSLQLLYYGEYGRLASTKEDWADTYRLAREFLGIERQREEAPEDSARREERRKLEEAQREQRRLAEKEEADRRKVARVLNAQEVWAESRSLVGTHGDAYLRARGLPPVAEWPWVPDEALRFHPALNYELDREVGRMPAIVGNVQDAWGVTIAVWQIYLNPVRPEKAGVENPKVGRGPASGGAVRLGGIASIIGVAEGIESALGAYVLEDYRTPVWATLSTSGMASFEPPMAVEQIKIWSDSDYGKVEEASGRILDPPGITAARALKNRLHPVGIRCTIQDGCVHGDALDLLLTKRQYEDRTKSP